MSERLKNPYGCMICHKTFSVSLHLVKHVELKHSSRNQPPIKPLIKIEPKDKDFDERNLNTDKNIFLGPPKRNWSLVINNFKKLY